MTISAAVSWGSAQGTDITGPYAIPFPLYSQTHLTILVVANGVPTTMALGTDYSFSSFETDNKGQCASPAITFTDAVAGGSLIVFLLTPPGTQLTAISNFSAFFPTLHEAEFDQLAQFMLRLEQWALKSLKAPDYEEAGDTDLNIPAVADRASKLLGFDADGNAEAVSSSDILEIEDVQMFGSFLNASQGSAITRVGTTATFPTGMQGLRVGDWVALDGADQDEYNKLKQITAVNNGVSFSFEVSGNPTTPSTGTCKIVFAFDGVKSKNLSKIAYIERASAGKFVFYFTNNQQMLPWQGAPSIILSGMAGASEDTVTMGISDGGTNSIYVNTFDHSGTFYDPDLIFGLMIKGLI